MMTVGLFASQSFLHRILLMVIYLGNSNPKFLRTTIREFPCTEDLMNSTNIPCGISFQPFATLRADEGSVPFVDYGNRSPIRCERCRGYLNPFVTFIE